LLPSAANKQHNFRAAAKLRMQLVNLAHEGKIGRRHRAWHRAARDADGLGLLRDAQLVITVDHRLAFSNPALLSAPS